MFIGSVPKPVVEQIMRLVPFGDWRKVFVCCSGSFRVDRAIAREFPRADVYSNDVSLLSCALGGLAVGREMDIKFTGRLEFVEHVLANRGYLDRVAAVIVALELAKYASDNEHSRAHFNHYVLAFEHYLEKGRALVDKFVLETRIKDFFAGDFRQHALQADLNGGGVVAFPPTYKGGYERLYKFLHENTQWTEPAYDIWNPKELDAWVGEMAERGTRFCVFADQVLTHGERIAEFYNPSNRPVYVYANDASGSSIRRNTNRAEEFKYTPVDASKLTRNSTVQLLSTDGAHMNYLKNIYLAKNIQHVTGTFNFLVLVDGMLVGGFIQTRSKWGHLDDLYMLSDFCISRERKLSKLVAMLATCRQVIDVIERKMLTRIKSIDTTAFTTKPISMKYRGIYELVGRKEGHLQYRSGVREADPQQIYREWFDKYGRN